MSSTGPQLPSSLSEKRKRDGHDEQSDNSSNSGSDIGPAPPNLGESLVKKPRVIGPSLPPTYHQNKPAELSHRSAEESDDSESDDDDFGPSLPPTGQTVSLEDKPLSTAEPSTADKSAAPSRRDDWMMVPPSGGDWSARIDPTKLKNRKFNTGKSAKGPTTGGDAGNSWHETPAEKQARLQREMMGIRDDKVSSDPVTSQLSGKSDAGTAQRLADYNKSRGPSLYNSHQQTKTEEDDDPSARVFDREKDIGGGLQINATKRKEMLKSASNLGSRFSNAKYL